MEGLEFDARPGSDQICVRSQQMATTFDNELVKVIFIDKSVVSLSEVCEDVNSETSISDDLSKKILDTDDSIVT